MAAIMGLSIATQSLAESFSDINASALAAFNSGDIGRATELTLEVVNQGEDLSLIHI